MAEQGLVKKERSPVEVTFSELEKMGQYIARSNLFGVKTPEQAIALMLIAQAEGLHPAMAARDYDVIQGRPALKAKAKLARFQRSGGVIHWHGISETKASATFRHPSAPEPITITWTMEDAKRAGLANKDNWKKYPRQMLSARVISEGVDKTYPDAGGLMYVPEEVIDIVDEPLDKPKQIRPASEAAKPAKSAGGKKKKAEQIVIWEQILDKIPSEDWRLVDVFLAKTAANAETTEEEIKQKALVAPERFLKAFKKFASSLPEEPPPAEPPGEEPPPLDPPTSSEEPIECPADPGTMIDPNYCRTACEIGRKDCSAWEGKEA